VLPIVGRKQQTVPSEDDQEKKYKLIGEAFRRWLHEWRVYDGMVAESPLFQHINGPSD